MRTSTTTKQAPRKHVAGHAQGMDAIAQLTGDHENIKAMFEQFASLGKRAFVTKKKLATRICSELSKHATAEDEIFYPAVRAAGQEEGELIDEATVEHASAKDLIAQIMAMTADEAMFDAKVKFLSELIDHHVKEEENEMFPKARKAGLDLHALCQQLAARKARITM